MNVGLWIDRTRAVIVSIAGKKESTVILESNVNKHFRSPAGKNDRNPNGRRDAAPDDIKERGFEEHLSVFYKKVISLVRGAGSILIFGPGESKGELEKCMLKSGLSGRIARVEAAGKMTDPQIAAKTRKYFKDMEDKNGAAKITSRAASNSRRPAIKRD